MPILQQNLQSLKVSELKKELQKLNLSTSGGKDELVQRLQSAYEQTRLDQPGEASGSAGAKRRQSVQGRKDCGKRSCREVSKTFDCQKSYHKASSNAAPKPWLEIGGKGSDFETVVNSIYETMLGGGREFPDSQSLQNLEFLGYLEEYLMSGFSEGINSPAFVISVITVLNEKFRHTLPSWECITQKEEDFQSLFYIVTEGIEQGNFSDVEVITCIEFLCNAIKSIDNKVVRSIVIKFLGLSSWNFLSGGRLKLELQRNPEVAKKWKQLVKKDKKLFKNDPTRISLFETLESRFFPNLFNSFDSKWVKSCVNSNGLTAQDIQFAEVSVQLLIDILSQLPTRRFFHAIILDKGLLVKYQRSIVLNHEPSQNLHDLVSLFAHVVNFPVNSIKGEAMTDNDLIFSFYERSQSLQRLFFKYWAQLREESLLPINQLTKKAVISKYLKKLSDNDMNHLVCEQLQIARTEDFNVLGRSYIESVFMECFRMQKGMKNLVDALPLYPTEELLLDPRKIPDHYSRLRSSFKEIIALPKINLQFLSLVDYLERNFRLYSIEAAYEIREHIFDVVRRLTPRQGDDGYIEFNGWSKMATEIQNFRISEIKPPTAGWTFPSAVFADFTIKGNSMDTWTEAGEWATAGVGEKRTLSVELDPIQYQKDIDNELTGIYSNFLTIVIRREAKENNFKALLASVRDMITNVEDVERSLPSWLLDLLIGYGKPDSALFFSIENQLECTIDFGNTFCSEEHLLNCFPSHQLEFASPERSPPYSLTFCSQESLKLAAGHDSEFINPKILVKSSNLDKSKATQLQPQSCPVSFTRVQVQAIVSASQVGLTMVVGPPGSGKTDTAVQMLEVLYNNNPAQRTLIVTHSNQALNDIFRKLSEREIKPEHMLRLGYGEAELGTEEEYNKAGRVNAILERRGELLQQVSRLANSMNSLITSDLTCETGLNFWKLNVIPRWERYLDSLARTDMTLKFPFTQYFFPQGGDREVGIDEAKALYSTLKSLFMELDELRPFEVLVSPKNRINYMLTKQARIIAMTCTHAALKRQEFLDLGFAFDNLLMEEAAQALDIETILPMTLNGTGNEPCQLKRVILIGDHHQLPPVIKNPILKSDCRFEQSLFSRLIRLNMSYIELNSQGRSRPSIAALYNWRYDNLGNLPLTQEGRYVLANPGFAFEYQFVDVEDFLGRGESEPVPFFYQNLGEAEFVTLTYQYMRLLGYSASSITILTTYNGQCSLIRDIMERKCSTHPLFGLPAAITTVDKYQGQQNDMILLSLVRSKHVGHLRDIRRLVVALSRARMGIYVFGREEIFGKCLEIKPSFSQMLARPQQLALVTGFNRMADQVPGDSLLVQGVSHMADIVKSMENEWRGKNNIF
eukprot:jgi/Picsp_1/6520/NSC_03864-R1_intron-binding protein aquarius-like